MKRLLGTSSERLHEASRTLAAVRIPRRRADADWPHRPRQNGAAMRFHIPTLLIAAASCGALAPVASANPIDATGVRTYERVCDNGMTYTTYKVGHGAAFVAGTDEK